MKWTVGMVFVGIMSLWGTARSDDLDIQAFTAVLSKYTGPNNVTRRDGLVAQQNLQVGRFHGFYLPLGGIEALNGRNGHQVDLGVGWTNQRFLEIDLLVDWVHGSLGKRFGNALRPAVKLFYDFSLDSHQITPFLRYEYFLPTEQGISDRGFFFQAGIWHTWYLTDHLLMQQEAMLTYDSGVFTSPGGLIVLWEGLLGYRIENPYLENLFITPVMFKVTSPLTEKSPDSKTKPVIVIGGSFALGPKNKLWPW